MSNIVVNIVAADVLAPLGARTSAGTVMTKFGSCIESGSYRVIFLLPLTSDIIWLV